MKITSIPELLSTMKMSMSRLADELGEDRLYINEFRFDLGNEKHVVIDHGAGDIRHRYQLMHVTKRNRKTRHSTQR